MLAIAAVVDYGLSIPGLGRRGTAEAVTAFYPLAELVFAPRFQ